MDANLNNLFGRIPSLSALDVKRAGVALSVLALADCGGRADPVPAPGQATIPDLTAYLVQDRCPDGKLEVAEPMCPGRAPQRAADPMLMRRFDWPPPAGYVAQDAIMGPDGPETLWSFAPATRFTPARGDGGEIYRVADRTVRIIATQDGGKPYLQGFYGAGCRGTGWVAFRDDAPTGRWSSLVATLSDRRVPSPCAAWSAALTRYRLEAVAAPWIVGGAGRPITRPTVIAEHYDHATLADSKSMERSFFAKGIGRIIWEAWTTGAPASRDLAARCPGTAWSDPPAPGWRLSDCRYATNLVATDGSVTGASFGWPPAMDAPP
jgi:hypothetical protein